MTCGHTRIYTLAYEQTCMSMLTDHWCICAVIVQCVRNPVQEGGEARGSRRGGADGAGNGQRDRVRVRVRAAAAAAAAVGVLRPGRGEGGVLRDVRRRGGGGRAVPAMGARRDALVAGVRVRPGDDKPVPVLLAIAIARSLSRDFLSLLLPF